MYKQTFSLIALVLLSAVVIVFMPYVQQGVQLLVSAHDAISELLTEIFSGGHAGSIARGLVALVSVPVLLGLIPAALYLVMRKHWFPYFMEVVWVIWLIQAGALIIIYTAPVAA